MLPALPHFALLACNALLDREAWARERLQRHAGKVILLNIAPFEQYLAIDRTGHLTAAHASAQTHPQVQVGLALRALPTLLQGDRQQGLQALHIQGEAALAQTLAELAQDLRWDPEDELARWTGDIPARRLVQGGRTLLAHLADTGQRLAQNLTEYATYETDALPRREAVEAWQHELAQVEQRTQQLLQRAAALLPPSPPAA